MSYATGNNANLSWMERVIIFKLSLDLGGKIWFCCSHIG